MAEPFSGEIRILAFNFTPKGWAVCDGALLPIYQNQALFALLGTNFGGDGHVTFALPDLRDRVPLHAVSSPSQIGTSGGEVTHTLTASELPQHAHALRGSANQATAMTPTGNVLAQKPRVGANVYRSTPNTTLSPASLGAPSGSASPHDNMQPYLALNFVISLEGVFPTPPQN
jgi:microcystin-dependent protein